MGRLIGTTTQYAFLPGTHSNSYGYDAGSNRTSMTAPDGSTNTYSYDTLNRLSSLTNSLTGRFGFGYDALSRRTQLTRPNGIRRKIKCGSHGFGNPSWDRMVNPAGYAARRFLAPWRSFLPGGTRNWFFRTGFAISTVPIIILDLAAPCANSLRNGNRKFSPL